MSDVDVDALVSAYLSIPLVLAPAASPGGDRVAFFRNDGGRYDLHVAPADGAGDARPLTDGEVARDPPGPPVWRADGGGLFAVDEAGGISLVALDGGVERVVAADETAFPHACTPGALWYARGGDLRRRGLWTGEETVIPDAAASAPSFTVAAAPDGDRVAYVGTASDGLANREVHVVAADGTDVRRLDVGAGLRTLPHGWHADGRRLLVSDDERGWGVHNADAGTTDWVEATGVRPVGFVGDAAVAQATWTADAGAFLVRCADDTVVEHGVDGRVALPRSAAVELAGERALAVQSTPTAPTRAVGFDPETGESETVVPPVTGERDLDSFVAPERVSIPGPDGDGSPGLLYLPDADGPVPAVCDVHGGRSEPNLRFERETQLLVALGYAVCQPTYRGPDFADAEHETIAAAGRWLAERDDVDDERVAVYGHSRGGYDAAVQAVRFPDAWAAAVADAGVFDLLDYPRPAREALGDPAEHEDAYRAASPVERAGDLAVPLLLLHGTADRVPVEQARRFRDALADAGREEGSDFEYAEFDDRDHDPHDPELAAARWRRVADFLDRRL